MRINKAIPYLIIGILIAWIIYDFKGCGEGKIEPTHRKDSIVYLQGRVDTFEVRVKEYLKAREKIVYRTKFDTTATIDTIIFELNNCDTSNQVATKTIGVLLEEISDLKSINRIQNDSIVDLDKKLKKAERNLKLRKLGEKVVATVVVVGTIVIIIVTNKD